MTNILTNKKPENISVCVNDYIAFGNTSKTLLNGKSTIQNINSNNYVITFTGVLYNQEEIKKILKEYNYSLNSDLDSELVLAAYICSKEDCLNYLDGAFSFAIFDKTKQQLFLARDRLGLKPLFYTIKNNIICFASEIKSILKYPGIKAKIGADELCEIFGLGPAHTPGKTFFKDILELEAGHYATYTSEGITKIKYWDLETNTIETSLENAISQTRELVKKSLKRQLKTSTPICTMLSGGLDSSVLTALAIQDVPDLKTFSINFEGNDKDFKGSNYQPTKDSDYVKIMKEFLHTNHTNVYFNNIDLFNSLKLAMITRDMPGMADIDSSMLIFCQKIASLGYKVCISGECSDEIFGGYPWYYRDELKKSTAFPWSRSFDVRANIINKKLVSSETLKNYIIGAYNNTISNVVYNTSDTSENAFRQTCYLTIKWFMNTLIERTDRMSMLAGLEVRVPFADYKLFEYIYNLSYKYKLGLIYKNTEPVEKYLLRKAFEDILPKEVVYRKKSPFPKTYDPEYLELLENAIKDIIISSTAPILQIIDVKYLFELLNTHGENLKENWFGQLMTYPQTLAYLIQVNMWLEEYNIEIDI